MCTLEVTILENIEVQTLWHINYSWPEMEQTHQQCLYKGKQNASILEIKLTSLSPGCEENGIQNIGATRSGVCMLSLRPFKY